MSEIEKYKCFKCGYINDLAELHEQPEDLFSPTISPKDFHDCENCNNSTKINLPPHAVYKHWARVNEEFIDSQFYGGPRYPEFYDHDAEKHWPSEQMYAGESYKYSDYIDTKGNILCEGDIVKIKVGNKVKLGYVDYDLSNSDSEKAFFQIKVLNSRNKYDGFNLEIIAKDETEELHKLNFKIKNSIDMFRTAGNFECVKLYPSDFDDDKEDLEYKAIEEKILNDNNFKYIINKGSHKIFVSSNQSIIEKIDHIERLKSQNKKFVWVAEKYFSPNAVLAHLLEILELNVSNFKNKLIDMMFFKKIKFIVSFRAFKN